MPKEANKLNETKPKNKTIDVLVGFKTLTIPNNILEQDLAKLESTLKKERSNHADKKKTMLANMSTDKEIYLDPSFSRKDNLPTK
jgi:hypothetical protein